VAVVLEARRCGRDIVVPIHGGLDTALTLLAPAAGAFGDLRHERDGLDKYRGLPRARPSPKAADGVNRSCHSHGRIRESRLGALRINWHCVY
jgi:hypothetical protein